jgi:hypothetical protein
MSLRVSAVHVAGQPGWETATVSTPNDVDLLVELLSQSDIGVAHVEHTGRPTIESDDPADVEPDHIVYLGINGPFGYFEYISPSFSPAVGALLGDPASPQWDAGGYVFHLGSGVSINEFTQLVNEFMTSGLPPRKAKWHDIEVHGQPIGSR